MGGNIKALGESTLALVAERFRILGDPVRLRLLQALAGGEKSVMELVSEAGTTQANVSKHLQLLRRAGLLRRRKQGLHVYYSIGDPTVFALCDAVCGSLERHRKEELSLFRKAGPRRSSPGR